MQGAIPQGDSYMNTKRILDYLRTGLAAGELLVDGTQDVIPDITDEMGNSWNQPSRFSLIFHMVPEWPGRPAMKPKAVYMSKASCNILSEYSSSTPSGVYPGKMWKGFWDDTWYLVWYTAVEGEPGFCKVHMCPILLLEAVELLLPKEAVDPTGDWLK